MVRTGKRRNADRLAELMAAAGDDPGACGLIASYMAAAQRQVDYLQHRYSHEDVEPMVMQALYLAAFTHKPGGKSFYWWFKIKLRGQTSRFRRHAKHREIGYLRAGRPGAGTVRQRIPPLKRVAYSERLIDHHFVYSSPEPTWGSFADDSPAR
jgi:hypothetical protein